MKLYLVRHGEAVGENVTLSRPLSDSGKDEVLKVANFLKRANVRVDELFHSNKKRAEETAEIIQKAISPKTKLVCKSYLGPEDVTDEIMYDLSQRKEDLMIVGHLPFLPRLISRLLVGDEDKNVLHMTTGSVVAMYRDPQQKWQIVWLVSPELI